MAVAYDTSVSGTVNGANSIVMPSLTTAQANSLLICYLHSSNTTPTALTFSTGSWTQATGSPLTISGGASGEMYVYYCLLTSTLSGVAITITMTSASFPQAAAIISAYNGHHLTVPIGDIDSSTANAASLSLTSTTTATNSLVVAGWGQTSNNNMTVGTGQTENTEAGSAGGFSRIMSSRRSAAEASSGASVTSDITLTSSLVGGFALEVKQAAAAATNTSNFFHFM